ncbi:MAG: endonuclease/exonuclease/phosphatase family protein [Rhizobiaceae bacterium]
MTLRRPGPWSILFGLIVPLLAALPLVAGFFGWLHPAFDTASHFRAHLAAGLATTGLLAAAIGWRREGAVAALLAIAALVTTGVDHPLPLPGGRAEARSQDGDGAVYRLLQANLLFNNQSKELPLSLIGRIEPDIVTLNEVSTGWLGKLDLIEAAYPYRVVCPSSTAIGGSAVLSRRPFAAGTAGHCLEDGRLAVATIDFNGRPVTVAAIHLHWPWPFGQHDQIDRIAPVLEALGPAAIAAGDFNASGWSHAARRGAALSRTQPVPPTGATWFPKRVSAGVRKVIGLPLDHVLAGADIDVIDAVTGPDVGSDHLPVIVTFALPEPAETGPGSATAMAALTH